MKIRKFSSTIIIIGLIAITLCACAVIKQRLSANPPRVITTFTTEPIQAKSSPTGAATLISPQTARNDEYLRIFEFVWSTVDKTFYDPDFGGVDWNAVHVKYEPLINAATDDERLYSLLNQMLWELNVSHTGVGPADEWPSIEPVAWGKGEIGIDIRLLDDQAVITQVEDESPAEDAGLRPGFVLQSIDGVPVEKILQTAQIHLAPPYNDQGRLDILTRSLLGLIYGEPGECVNLAFLDELDESHEICIERVKRPWMGTLGEVLPPAYLEFESRLLDGRIGYIRFNTFHQNLIPDMVDAIESFQDTPGIILDLRGNPGGDPGTAEKLAAQFLNGQLSFGSFKTRSGEVARLLTGKNVYTGPLVILIDALSFSGSEYFASGMQALGRGTIIGERSPGGTSGMNVTKLPNGAILGYPVAQLITPDGQVLEGLGVIPDIAIGLERSQLLDGIDTQLQAGIDYIYEKADTRMEKTDIFQEMTVKTTDANLYVGVTGKLESGNILIAIHGGPGNSSDYMVSLGKLAGDDLAVVIYDQRGTGRSTSPGDDASHFTLRKYIDDLEAIRAAVGADNVFLLGHSWGGVVAMRYATVYPERVHGLILMGSGAPSLQAAMEAQERKLEHIRNLQEQGIIPHEITSLQDILPAYFSDPAFQMPAELQNLSYNGSVEQYTWIALGDFDFTNETKDLVIPVLVLYGKEDPFGMSMVDAVVASLAKADIQLVLLEKCGHYWHECPDRFFEEVRDFLESSVAKP